MYYKKKTFRICCRAIIYTPITFMLETWLSYTDYSMANKLANKSESLSKIRLSKIKNLAIKLIGLPYTVDTTYITNGISFVIEISVSACKIQRCC